MLVIQCIPNSKEPNKLRAEINFVFIISVTEINKHILNMYFGSFNALSVLLFLFFYNSLNIIFLSLLGDTVWEILPNILNMKKNHKMLLDIDQRMTHLTVVLSSILWTIYYTLHRIELTSSWL